MPHFSSGIATRIVVWLFQLSVSIDILASIKDSPMTECGVDVAACSPNDPCTDDYFDRSVVTAIAFLALLILFLVVALSVAVRLAIARNNIYPDFKYTHYSLIVISALTFAVSVVLFVFVMTDVKEPFSGAALPVLLRQCATQGAQKYYWQSGCAFIAAGVYVWIAYETVPFIVATFNHASTIVQKKSTPPPPSIEYKNVYDPIQNFSLDMSGQYNAKKN